MSAVKTKIGFGLLLAAVFFMVALPHAGMAASKSDNDIKESINNTLNPFNGVRISVAAGIVTLGGTVPDEAHRNIAVDAAKNTPGVILVRDNIRVAQGKGGGVSGAFDDAGITAKVKAELLSQTGLNVLGISVDTINGVVMLTGEVDSADESRLAAEYAARVSGVKKVDNRLRIKRK